MANSLPVAKELSTRELNSGSGIPAGNNWEKETKGKFCLRHFGKWSGNLGRRAAPPTVAITQGRLGVFVAALSLLAAPFNGSNSCHYGSIKWNGVF